MRDAAYLLEPVLSFSALGLDGGELGDALGELLGLDAEPDMLLEPLGLLESFRESCDEDDWDGVEEALLPGVFVRSQAASVSAPAARAIRNLVALRVM